MSAAAKKMNSVRSGFLGGAVVALVASGMAWRGWASGGKLLAEMDLAVGAFLVCVWIAWEFNSRSTKRSKNTT